MDNLKIFDSKVSDNTIKPTFHKLDEINNKKNPLQQFLIKKYGDKATMEKKIREIVGDDENQINRENLFEFYKQSLNKEKLGIEDRQQFYKLTENLRFREDDAKVSIKDFADLAFGYLLLI